MTFLSNQGWRVKDGSRTERRPWPSSLVGCSGWANDLLLSDLYSQRWLTDTCLVASGNAAR